MLTKCPHCGRSQIGSPKKCSYCKYDFVQQTPLLLPNVKCPKCGGERVCIVPEGKKPFGRMVGPSKCLDCSHEWTPPVPPSQLVAHIIGGGLAVLFGIGTLVTTFTTETGCSSSRLSGDMQSGLVVGNIVIIAGIVMIVRALRARARQSQQTNEE